jgi:hypothetical protein
MTREQIGGLTVGQRDAALLTLRAYTFGERLVGLAGCPKCSEQVEMDFRVAEILLPSAQAISAEQTLVMDEYRVLFRLPNAFDLAALGQEGDSSTGERRLLQRCLIEAYKGDEACLAVDLPDRVVSAISSQMAMADPQAEIELALTCPAQWQTLFDIVTFFWQEIDAWAIRTLHEVHLLASVYGWREADILALSPWRRQFYLDRISA